MEFSIAEIPYDSGAVRYQYSRYLSEAGDRWIRHGPFFAYHEDGELAAKGSYDHGAEHGPWEDYHPNGQLAAQGVYENGVKAAMWRYWQADGTPET